MTEKSSFGVKGGHPILPTTVSIEVAQKIFFIARQVNGVNGVFGRVKLPCHTGTKNMSQSFI